MRGAIWMAVAMGWANQAMAVDFTLQPELGWVNTGVSVSSGDTLTITATGQVFYANRATGWTDPDGVGPENDGTTIGASNVIAPGAINVSHVGRIGLTDLVPEGSPGKGQGFVGSSYSQVISSSGDLYLGFNDAIFGDNSGSYDVTITVTPAGTSVPAVPPTGLMLLGLALGGIGISATMRRQLT